MNNHADIDPLRPSRSACTTATATSSHRRHRRPSTAYFDPPLDALFDTAADSVPDAELNLVTRADALVTTVRRAFEPATEPAPATLRAAAGELADVYRQWRADLTDAPPNTTLPKAWTRT